ncbi:MAG: threonine/serine dehydratase [Terriglobia bacterium]
MPQIRDGISTVALADVRAARERIANEIIRTPLVFSEAASRRAGGQVYLKLENLQRTGTFKVRGALSKVTSLTPEERQRGMVCASSGNHGLGVAYASSRLGVRCVVVLPQNANPHKMSLLKELGAEVICYGETSDVCQQKANEISQENGYTLLHPFADPVLIAGQGTVGLEVLEELAGVEEVYVPIGGGGLISGIAVAIKEQRPKTRIWGVQPQHANSMWAAIRQGRVVSLDEVRTIADGLTASVTWEINLAHVQRYVEDVILVSDQAILDSMLFLLEHAKVLVEPSGAASFAGLLANSQRRGQAVAVMSGGNVSLQQIDGLRQIQGT